MTMLFWVISVVFMCSCAFAGVSADEGKRVVIFLGPPGSGKGTQAVELAKELNIPHISTGDLFRDHMQLQTPLGIEAKKYVDAGQLSPDQLVTDMLLERVGREDAKKGYLLDGYPRNLAQAKVFESFLEKEKVQPIVIYLNVSDEVVTKRLGGRLLCRKAGHVFNIYFSPPKKEAVCDICGSELYQRSDDSPEVIAERLKVYHELTQPLIEFYQKKGVIHKINGELPSDQVQVNILKVITSANTQ